MKNILYVLFYALFFSCSTQKKNNLNEKYTAPISIERKLTSTESKIINDFIDVELKKERYKNYRDAEIVIIEEALNKHQSVETYIYSNNEWISMNKVNRREDIENQYFLDSLRIKKLKIELEKEELYYWKVTDFRNIKVSLLKYEELRTIINTGAYSKFSSRMVIYLSKPLILNENNAFISFEIGNGHLGFHSINHFTVLMKKIDNKWEQSNYYYDGVYN